MSSWTLNGHGSFSSGSLRPGKPRTYIGTKGSLVGEAEFDLTGCVRAYLDRATDYSDSRPPPVFLFDMLIYCSSSLEGGLSELMVMCFLQTALTPLSDQR